MACSSALQFFFLGSTLLELLIPMELLQFAVLLFFCASGLPNKCTKDHPSPAQPRAILYLLSVTEPAFPRENFDPTKPESLTFGWDFWTSGLHKGLPQNWKVQPLLRRTHRSTAHSTGGTPEPVHKQGIYCACA